MIKQAFSLAAAVICTAIGWCANYTRLALLPPIKTRQYRIISLAALIILGFSPLRAQMVNEAWVRSDTISSPRGIMIAMDSQENVVVTGCFGFGGIVTEKYDPDGNLLWEQHFTIPDHAAAASWILVDAFDNVVITGYPLTYSGDPVQVGLLTIKYDSDGNLLWSDTYSGTWAFAVRGISDADGNIYVAGRAWFGTYDFVTIKYAPDGTRLWVDVFDQNGGFHTPNSMDLDSQGHLIINGAGLSGGFITVLYNTDGVRQWVLEGLGNTATWVKLSGDGYFYLTGSFYNIPTGNDIWLLKYDLNENLIWERHYDFGVTSEYGTMLTSDSQGNVIVTGVQGVYMHWITIKVNPQGTLLWSNEYSENPHNDAWPSFIMTGPVDEVYITGVGGPAPPGSPSFQSMATLRYNSDGSNPWTASYRFVQRGVGLVLANDNSVYVAGNAENTVIKYNQTLTSVGGDEIAGVPQEFTLSQNYPNPFNAQTTIKYSLPKQSDVSIDIFDILGRKLKTLTEGEMPAGEHQVVWDASGQSSGTYFYRIKAGEKVETRKMLLMK